MTQINGELTLGENIADNGGLRETFNAYQLHVNQFGKEKRLAGFENYTHNQLLFLAFGNVRIFYKNIRNSLFNFLIIILVVV